jgi:hypothetical protein
MNQDEVTGSRQNIPQGDRISSAPEGEECKNTQNVGDLALLNSRIKRHEAKVAFMSQELAESRRRQESDAIVRFKDPLGRRFTFPFTLCRTWQVSSFNTCVCLVRPEAGWLTHTPMHRV